jgi:hypothetical protein
MRMIIRHSNLWPGSGGYLVLHNHSSVRHSSHKSGVTTFGAPLGIQWGVFSFELPAKLPVSLRAGPAQAALPPRPSSYTINIGLQRFLFSSTRNSEANALRHCVSRADSSQARQGKASYLAMRCRLLPSLHAYIMRQHSF